MRKESGCAEWQPAQARHGEEEQSGRHDRAWVNQARRACYGKLVGRDGELADAWGKGERRQGRGWRGTRIAQVQERKGRGSEA